MNLKKNQEYETTITGMTTEGSGVGRVEGTAVFISNTAVGDIVRTRIIKTSKNYAIGRVQEIIKPSKDRSEPDCKYFNQCGGCVYRHISYEAECDIKYQRVKDAVSRIGGFENLEVKEIVGGKSRCGYRNKAQIPVGVDNKGNTVMGFYAYHSHRIVDSDLCLLQPNVFYEISNILRKWIYKFDIKSYNEITNKGLLRHLYIRIAEVTGEIMVCLVINGNKIEHTDELIESLKAIQGFKSLQLNINKEKTNVILGKKCITLYGSDYITDVLCGLKFNISPLSFYQVNRTQAEKLYSIAKSYAQLDKDDVLLDLYCGTGTIGLSMAKDVKKLIGVEIIPQAIENAVKNAELNGIDNAEFICADASEASIKLEKRGIKPDVIVVDPPRKGCDKALIETISKMSPKRVVYVSCDSATMARDIKIFNELGYVPQEVTPVDMFPGTSHVETVVLLSHKKPDGHINVKVEFGEGEGKVPLDNIAKRAETYKPKERVTYKMIKEYIEAKYGFKVHTAYIAEVKRDLGLPMYDAPNAVEELKQPRKHPTPEKVEAIKDALKHFEVI